MTRAAAWCVGATLLVVLLTQLFLRTLDPERARSAGLAETVRELEAGEVAMQRDALLARAGMLRNYDPLATTMAAAISAATVLETDSRKDTVLGQRARDIRTSLARQENFLESFKTANALMWNSAAYFDQLALQTGAGAAADGRAGPVEAGVGSLALALLQLTHNASGESTARADAALSALLAAAQQDPQDPRSADAAVLVRHGRVLSAQVSAVDASLRALLASSSSTPQADYLRALDDDRARRERTAGLFRVALYAIALVLAALLAILGAQLRARTRAMQHRREAERSITRVSSQLVGCAPEEMDAVLGEAAAVLGRAFRADRCYLLRPGGSLQVQSWHAPGQQPPPGWPTGAWALAEEQPDAAGVAWTERLSAGATRHKLRAVGIAGWGHAALFHGDDRIGLLGFDRARQRRAWGMATWLPGPWARDAWPPGGPGLLGLAADVLAGALRRQRLLREREDLKLRLSRARRLEAVGTFASGIAHNFNNVVGAIMGHAEMAAEGLPEHDPRGRHLDEVRRAGGRARELVSHILDYGSRGSSAPVALPVAAMLAESVAMLGPAIESPLHLDVPAGADRLTVVGQAGHLQQVVLNLLRNAAQAVEADGVRTEPGSRVIKVGLSAATLAQRRGLSHGDVGPGRYARIAVADAGVGMDEATLGQLFQPFFTRRAGGTGLGLATAWEIVRDHDGAFDVRSTPGQGTVFEVWLPLLDTDADPGDADGREYRRGAGETVLVINSDREGRLRDEDVLAALGYEPVGFGSMLAASEAYRDAPDRFSAVVIDTTVGYWTGEAAWPAFEAYGCPVILIGSDPSERSAAELEAHGLAAVIARPARLSVLAAALACRLPP